MNTERSKKKRRQVSHYGLLWTAASVFLLCWGVNPSVARGPAGQNPLKAEAQENSPTFRLLGCDFDLQKVSILAPSGRETEVLLNQKAGSWALMAVVEDGGGRLAVFENVDDGRGNIVFLSRSGIVASLAKSMERTSVPPESLYGGHSLEEIGGRGFRGGQGAQGVRGSRGGRDVLGAEILAEPGDPSYERVAPLFPPLRVPTFVGTRHSIDKPTFEYGAFSDEIYVDVGKVFPEIAEARERLDVWEGIVGGWLPVPRFVFPAGENRYWDVLIFAEEDPSKFWTQPIWFRILCIEDAQVKEAHFFYHHLPYPPRGEPPAEKFYAALLTMSREWHKVLKPTLRIDVPEARIQDFCLHALAMEMITRVGNQPKYGYPPLGGINVFGGYGYSNVDTFQDVFNSSVITFSEWGLLDIARGYIDHYFTEYVRDDGSIDTRGPETGQYGLMLAAIAKYYNYSKDAELILKHRKKICGIVDMFYSLRSKSKKVSVEDPSYGIITGWSEHDSCLKVDPYSLMQPFFSNNADACRGFIDVGQVFVEIGENTSNSELVDVGRGMIEEADEMKKDLYTSMQRSMRTDVDPPALPAVAGDRSRVFAHRVYAELMQSGILTKDYASAITRFGADGERRLAGRGGFLFYGFGYGILHHDWIREFLLSYYSVMAHGYSRGTWTSVESAAIDMSRYAPYCTCSQLTIPALTKWMLVFEDPNEPVLWLAKAAPRRWLDDGQKIAVEGAPTRFGTVGYVLTSEIGRGRISGSLDLPAGAEATVKVRIRVPGNRTMKSVRLNGRPWSDFDPALEIVTLGPSVSGRVELEVNY
jgi:hypothetical protein